jgi:hypothetical protein
MMRSLFSAAWNTPGPSAVPSVGYHLAIALASFAFAVTAHAGMTLLGI